MSSKVFLSASFTQTRCNEMIRCSLPSASDGLVTIDPHLHRYHSLSEMYPFRPPSLLRAVHCGLDQEK
jgi:hypothetical protein